MLVPDDFAPQLSHHTTKKASQQHYWMKSFLSSAFLFICCLLIIVLQFCSTIHGSMSVQSMTSYLTVQPNSCNVPVTEVITLTGISSGLFSLERFVNSTYASNSPINVTATSETLGVTVDDVTVHFTLVLLFIWTSVPPLASLSIAHLLWVMRLKECFPQQPSLSALIRSYSDISLTFLWAMLTFKSLYQHLIQIFLQQISILVEHMDMTSLFCRKMHHL